MRPPRKPKKRRLKPRSPDVASQGEYPFVAIVGRPNVGKSTLFNRLVGQRLAITEPTAGTTRDRVAALVRLEDGRVFELCDTGGIGGTGDPLDQEVNRQIDLALQYADVILLVVDARVGLLQLDRQIAGRVLRLKKPVLLVVNKVESRQLEMDASEFYGLGFEGELLCASALEGTGRSELLRRLGELLPAEEEDEEQASDEEQEDEGRAAAERPLRIAIVGKRNVGKSTLVNQVAGEERVIASDRPGTTRDSVDVLLEVKGKPVVLIDTAGLRKRGRADDNIEIISHGRAIEAVRRCDVALLLLDCLEEVTEVDKKLAGLIEKEHKACVIVANKWDQVQGGMTPEKYASYVAHHLPGLSFAPVCCISALLGTYAGTPIGLAFDLFEQSQEKVGTGQLNRAVAAALERRRPKAVRGQVGKVYFCTQVAKNPVTLLLFVNVPALFDAGWRRYLQNQLRSQLPWAEVPIKLVLRSRSNLTRRSGDLARRVEALGGLADQSRLIEASGHRHEIQALADEMDADDIKEALRDELGLGHEAEEEAPPAEGDEGEELPPDEGRDDPDQAWSDDEGWPDEGADEDGDEDGDEDEQEDEGEEQ